MSEAPRGPFVRIFDFRTKTISTTVIFFSFYRMAAEEKGSLAAMGGRSGECSLCRQETFLYEDPSVTLEVIKGILDRLKE